MNEKSTKLLRLQYELDIIKAKIENLSPILKDLAMDEDLDKMFDPDYWKKKKRKEAQRKYYLKTKEKK